MAITFSYHRGQELPGINLPWQTADGLPLDLTTGYTVRCDIYRLGAVAPIASKTSGVAGYAGGVTIDWDSGDLDIDEGAYRLLVVATDGLGNDRVYSPGALPRVSIYSPSVA